MWQETGNYEIDELELDGPREGEVLVRFDYAGLCHTDEHLRNGDLDFTPPMVGGHEGAGVVEEVGAGVTHLKAGDPFVTSWMPSCGRCRFCVTGQTNLCDNGQFLMSGTMLDGTQRLHGRGRGVGAVDLLGTFSQWNVIPAACVVPLPHEMPLDKAAIVACGGPTGWGSAVNAANTTGATHTVQIATLTSHATAQTNVNNTVTIGMGALTSSVVAAHTTNAAQAGQITLLNTHAATQTNINASVASGLVGLTNRTAALEGFTNRINNTLTNYPRFLNQLMMSISFTLPPTSGRRCWKK
jgi:Zn-dependent alcohol dehydrogenase